MKLKYLAGCCFAFITASAFAECPTDKVAVTRSGYYGALNHDAYGEMDQAIRLKDKATLSSLLTQRSVAEMPAGKRVCIIVIDFHGYRKQIELPGSQIPYWVPDEALTEVR
jgi:hypothetical protein